MYFSFVFIVIDFRGVLYIFIVKIKGDLAGEAKSLGPRTLPLKTN